MKFWNKCVFSKKNILAFFVFVFLGGFISTKLYAHKIERLSQFMIMGEHELRAEEGFENQVLYTTINHESGMKVLVLDVGKKENLENKNGTWLKIRTTAPMWVESGDWIEKYSDFWIFLLDEEKIFDFVEC